MDKAIEYQQFDGEGGQASGPAHGGGPVDLGRIGEIPMELSVQIGRTQMTMGETLALRVGSVVILDRFAGEPVDLLVNGTPIARGEVVVVEEKFGLRMEEILEDQNGEPENVFEHRPPESDAEHAGAGEQFAAHEQELAA